MTKRNGNRTMENNGTHIIQSREFREAWIKKIKDICIRESMHTGIYPSITIAQTILESATGTSNLAVNYYNFVGISMPSICIDNKVSFWDGSEYICKNYKSWADFTQAGDSDSGFELCIKYYGRNFWVTEMYALNGVLNHISSGLTTEEGRADAMVQLEQLARIYAPQIDGNCRYRETLFNIIETYDLWKCDEEFLSLGGWKGISPYWRGIPLHLD